MNHILTKGIILTRSDYGEADRILTILTPDQGKLRLMAKGVRRVKSKLAGGIELFSVSDIAFVRGRGDIGTLVSTRLETYFSNIIKDINRTMLGYELLKLTNKNTEDEPEADYFDVLCQAIAALDDETITPELTRLWVIVQFLQLSGHALNLHTDINGQNLSVIQNYEFNFDRMAFEQKNNAAFSANHIKFLRLFFAAYPPKTLQQIHSSDALSAEIRPLIQNIAATYLRI
jgi:DNA repair protein RecO (recombination protein O)